MKNMVDVVAAHGGKFNPFSQTKIMNRVPPRFREGVCSGASAIFLYLNALRHSQADDDSLYRYMTTLDDFLTQTEVYVEQGLNLSAKQQEWISKFKETPQEELLEKLELFKSAQYKLNYKDLESRGRNNDRLDMNLKPTNAERKKIVQYKKSNGTKTEVLSFRNYVQFRSIDRIVELQRIMDEKDSLPRGPFEDVNFRANEEQLSILSGRKVKRLDGDGDGFLLFDKDRIADIFRNNGCYIISTPKHAHAAYLNDAATPARFKYFEPNFGIASFTSRTKFTDFLADWLLTSERYVGQLDFSRFSL